MFVAAALLVVGGPSSAAPSRTACKVWDNAALGTFHLSLGVIVLLIVLAWLGLLLFASRSWLLSRSWIRALIPAAVVFLVVSLAVVLVPRFLGPGMGWLGGAPPEYKECSAVSFGATGLFSGRIGSGVPATDQWMTMLTFQLLAAILAFLLIRLFEVAWKKLFGVGAAARRGTR